MTRRKRDVTRKKNHHMQVKLGIFWALVLISIALLARWLGEREGPREESQWSDQVLTGTPADEEIATLQAAMPDCQQTLLEFLLANRPEVRAQHVYNPLVTIGKMSRFYQQFPFVQLDPEGLQFVESELLKLSDEVAVETRWKTAEGPQVDAIFREQDGEWRLDWEHFVRYSDSSWPAFLTKTGESEEEFRLLARERSSGAGRKTGKLSIAFYAPKFAEPDEVGQPSPEFLLDESSSDGQLLKQAFDAAAERRVPFRSVLKSLDPDGMIRVRVKIRRWTTGETNQFEITQVVACHWLSTDESGFK